MGLGSRSTSSPGTETYRSATGLPFELLETKLRPPHLGDESIPRTLLVERLDDLAGPPIVVACAAAGYGKTTALAQWVASRARPDVAWVSIDAHDDDPVVLLTYVAVALDRIAPIDPGVFEALTSTGTSIETTVLPRLGAALADAEAVSLVLDDVHAIENPQSVDAIVALAAHVPQGSRLVLSTRDHSAFPLARWRTRGLTAELGPEDLRMDEQEARGLLEATAAGFSDEHAGELVRRTEGWPAGLYLAALSARARGVTAATASTFSGNDPLVADFLRSELLASLPAHEVRFLMQTSLLEQLSGSLCDAVLESSGSDELLESWPAPTGSSWRSTRSGRGTAATTSSGSCSRRSSSAPIPSWSPRSAAARSTGARTMAWRPRRSATARPTATPTASRACWSAAPSRRSRAAGRPPSSSGSPGSDSTRSLSGTRRWR